MKIAIVKLSALGDIIHAMVALQFIKKHIPNAQIDWVVEKGFKPILENNPDINKIHSIELKKAKSKKSIFLLIKELLKLRKLPKYDIVIDAQGLIKSALVARVIPSRKTYGFDQYSIREKTATKLYSHHVNIGYDQNTIERNLKVICEPLGVQVSSQDIIAKKAFLFGRPQQSIPAKPYVVLVIGSTWESRNYPKEKFSELAKLLQFPCYVLWGNDAEKSKANWISQHVDNAQMADRLNLLDLKSFMANAALVIGNDTGPTHMAWGLNVPSITLFGPTPINRVYQTPINKVLKSSSKVDHFKLDKNDYSISEIKVEHVLDMSNRLLGKKL